MDWISVRDRLPEQEEYVAVYDAADGCVSVAYTFEGWWRTDGDADPEQVTHWMPLPEPPKEEE